MLGVGIWKLEIVLSESARMSTAAEARFRIQTPPDTNRAVKVIDLDSASVFHAGLDVHLGQPVRRRDLPVDV